MALSLNRCSAGDISSPPHFAVYSIYACLLLPSHFALSCLSYPQRFWPGTLCLWTCLQCNQNGGKGIETVFMHYMRNNEYLKIASEHLTGILFIIGSWSDRYRWSWVPFKKNTTPHRHVFNIWKWIQGRRLANSYSQNLKLEAGGTTWILMSCMLPRPCTVMLDTELKPQGWVTTASSFLAF